MLKQILSAVTPAAAAVAAAALEAGDIYGDDA